MRELFWLFILVSIVIMIEARARKFYDFEFKQAVIKHAEEKSNR